VLSDHAPHEVAILNGAFYEGAKAEREPIASDQIIQDNGLDSVCAQLLGRVTAYVSGPPGNENVHNCVMIILWKSAFKTHLEAAPSVALSLNLLPESPFCLQDSGLVYTQPPSFDPSICIFPFAARNQAGKQAPRQMTLSHEGSHFSPRVGEFHLFGLSPLSLDAAFY